MKFILLVTVFLLSYVLFYLMLSSLALIVSDESYIDILHQSAWVGVYGVFIGPILATFPTREYYLNNESSFKRIL